MLKNCWILYLTLFSVGLSLATPKARAQEISIDTLTKLPAISNLTLSHDGDYLVGLVGQENAQTPALAVWDTSDLTKLPKLVTPSGDVDFVAVEAMKAGKILVVARKKWSGVLAGCGEGKLHGTTRTYLFKTMVTDTELLDFDEPFSYKGRDRNMSDREKVCSEIIGTGNIAADLPLDPDNIIISQRSGAFDRTTNYIKYNLHTSKGTKLFNNSENGFVGLLHPKSGEVLTRGFSDYSDGRYKAKLKIKNNEGAFQIHEELTSDSQDRHHVNLLGRDDKTGKYYVSTDKFSDKASIYLYDPALEKFDSSALYSHPKFNVSSIVRSTHADDFGEVLGYNVEAANIETTYLDSFFNNVKNKFKQQYPDKTIRISDWSIDRSILLITVEGSDMPTAYFITTDKKSFKFLGSRVPELAKASLSKTELVYYPARDEKRIPGLLTMPTGWVKGDPAPPAIVHPHGGPWARDYAGWDASNWIPFLTSRGYAVLQPQYRGSTGWGRDIWLSGDAEWGQKMQDDKDDGANWMIENGYANKDKVAIFGYSYGGFAAFAAAVRPEGPFKCAIAGAGVSDLTRLGRLWSNNSEQRAYQGKTVKGMDPMKNVENASIPMLMFHGDRDVRVPDAHATRFHKKIKKNVNSKLVIIKDQPHSLPWSPKMQKTSLEAIESFLENDCFANE